jgi:hypothetical protein
MRSRVDFLGSQNSFWVLIYIYFLFYFNVESELGKVPTLMSPSFQLFLNNYVAFDGRPRTFELFPVIGRSED